MKRYRNEKSVRRKLMHDINRQLLHYGSPRFQMILILTVTGLAGLFASIILTHFGLHTMALRYPIAVMFSYASFFLCIRLWIIYIRSQEKYREEIFDEAEDVIDTFDGFSTENGCSEDSFSASDFAGDVGGDEFSVVIIAIGVVFAFLFFSGYMIYIAPAFLGEILFDFLVVSVFYKNVSSMHKNHWAETALLRSWIPFTVLSILLAISGLIIQGIYPEVKNVTDILVLIFG